MKLRDIKNKMDDIVKLYPESLDWEVFVEDEDLYTFGNNTLRINEYPENMIEQNRKTIRKVKEETDMGWKFLKVKDCAAPNDEDDAFEYYKECAGGLGVVADKKAITIHINL